MQQLSRINFNIWVYVALAEAGEWWLELVKVYCRPKIMFKMPYGVIENEFHLLLVCPNYYDLRRKFLKPYFCHWPTIRKIETLLCNKNMVQLSNLAKFIYL